MLIFGIRFNAKREPRYPSYKQYEELNWLVQTMSEGLINTNKAVEAMRKKVYREGQKEEAEVIIKGDGESRHRAPLTPGEILTTEQVANIFLGKG